VGHEHDGLGAVVEGILDGGDGADDALVVGDVLVLVEGDVEVDLRPLAVVCTMAGSLDGGVGGQRQLTRIRTLLPLTSTSVMDSLLERDMFAGECDLTRSGRRY
jgi:hypothetical protein